MAKEILNNANDLVVSRTDLEKFISEVKLENPKISFDLSILDKMEYPKLWFLQILQNESLKDDLMKIAL